MGKREMKDRAELVLREATILLDELEKANEERYPHQMDAFLSGVFGAKAEAFIEVLHGISEWADVAPSPGWEGADG